MRNIFKHTFPALAACALLAASCSDWTEPESVGVYYPSREEQNPELYASYIQDLKEYKSKEHKLVIVSMENVQGTPYNQAERLTALPDSIDIVCLNTPDNLSDGYLEEMGEVRKKGTRIVYSIDYASIETAWQAQVEKDATLTEEQAVDYIGKCTDEMLALSDRYGYDGIIADYAGKLYSSLKEEEVEAYNARQRAFLNRLAQWQDTHTDKVFAFYGDVRHLVPANMNILDKCSFIVLKSAASTSASDLNQLVKQTLQAGEDAKDGYEGVNPIPTDRFVACAQRVNEKGEDYYWNTKDADGAYLLGTKGTAQWVSLSSSDYTRKGIFILNVKDEYYNNDYQLLREIINTMNPNE